MNQKTREKVLVLAYYSNPYDVSGPLVAYREYEQSYCEFAHIFPGNDIDMRQILGLLIAARSQRHET